MRPIVFSTLPFTLGNKLPSSHPSLDCMYQLMTASSPSSVIVCQVRYISDNLGSRQAFSWTPPLQPPHLRQSNPSPSSHFFALFHISPGIDSFVPTASRLSKTMFVRNTSLSKRPLGDGDNDEQMRPVPDHRPGMDADSFRLVEENDNRSRSFANTGRVVEPEDDRKGVPCHVCGAIVHIYKKRTWYAIIRGLDIGVHHTW